MTLLTSASLCCLFGLAAVNGNAIEVYKSIGEHGEVKYSQHPPRGVKDVELIVLRSDGRQVSAGKMAGKTDPNQQVETKTAEEQRIAELEARIKEKERLDNAKVCQSLRNNLANLNMGGRIYETDEEGNRQYLDNREIELKRESIQKALQAKNCGGTAT